MKIIILNIRALESIIQYIISAYVWSEKSTMFLYFEFNTLSANTTKWSNTLKQFVGNLPTNCLSVFDYFVILALKELIKSDSNNYYVNLSYIVAYLSYMWKRPSLFSPWFNDVWFLYSFLWSKRNRRKTNIKRKI